MPFVILDDSVNEPNSLVGEIFDKSDDEFEFHGFHREEFGRFSNVEVEEYDESNGSDTDGRNETEDEMEVQTTITAQEWTKNFTELIFCHSLSKIQDPRM